MGDQSESRSAAWARRPSCNRPYSFDRFKVVGLQPRPAPRDNTSDGLRSGSATAIACGREDQQQDDRHGPWPSKPVSRRSSRSPRMPAALATGLVTTTRITHATPACFATHVKAPRRRGSRHRATSSPRKGYPEVLIGGGSSETSSSERSAGVPARPNGYTVELDHAKLMNTKPRSEAVKGKDGSGTFDLPARASAGKVAHRQEPPALCRGRWRAPLAPGP